MPNITIENKSKVTIHGLKPGAQRTIKADEHGTPLEIHWRRRMNDARIDGAIVKVENSISENITETED